MKAPQQIRIVGDEAQFDVFDRQGRKRGTVRIDAKDADRVGQYRWSWSGNEVAADGGRRSLARYVVKAHKGDRVEHLNRDPWDNRRQNLHKRRVSSRERGVFWHAGTQRWHARLAIDGKRHYIGEFKTEAEAIAAIEAWKRDNQLEPRIIHNDPLEQVILDAAEVVTTDPDWQPRLTLDEPEAQPLCTVTGCSQPVVRRRLCAEHWRRLREIKRPTPKNDTLPLAAGIAIPLALVWLGVRCWRKR